MLAITKSWPKFVKKEHWLQSHILRPYSDHLINQNFTVCGNKKIYLTLFLDSLQLYQCHSDRDQVAGSDFIPWRYHDMEMLSALLALCEGNPLVREPSVSEIH